jgi:hypothetical protein
MSWSQLAICYGHPRQKSSEARISLIKHLKSCDLLLNQSKNFCRCVYLICESGVLEAFGHDSQMNTFLAAGSKSVQSFRKGLSSSDIDSDTIKCEACLGIDTYFIDEVCLPSDELSEKGVRVGEDAGLRVLVCESTLLVLHHSQGCNLEQDDTEQ